jgi:hypothetical protein
MEKGIMEKGINRFLAAVMITFLVISVQDLSGLSLVRDI